MSTVTKRTWVHDGKTRVAYQFATTVNGARVRRQFSTKAEALEELDSYKEGLKQPKLRPMSLGEAVALYLETKASKRSLEEDRRALEEFRDLWGKETPLTQITAAKISAWQVAALKRKAGKSEQTVAPATINRALAALRHLLRLAWRRWEALPQAPHIELEKEPEGRLRYLDEDEITRLMAACAKPRRKHLAGIVTVALHTGMRLGEITGLTWDRVDFSRGVLVLEAEHTKGKRRREIPTTQTVFNLLSALTEPRTGRVFSVDGVRTSYTAALDDAKIDDATFHTLRHTFASHYMMRGGNLYDLKNILGHRNIKLTARYSHLSPSYLRSQMERMEGLTPVPAPLVATNLPQEIEFVGTPASVGSRIN